jgi:hypothetical protein
LEIEAWAFLLFCALALEFSGSFGKSRKHQLQIPKQKEVSKYNLQTLGAWHQVLSFPIPYWLVARPFSATRTNCGGSKKPRFSGGFSETESAKISNQGEALRPLRPRLGYLFSPIMARKDPENIFVF